MTIEQSFHAHGMIHSPVCIAMLNQANRLQDMAVVPQVGSRVVEGSLQHDLNAG